MRYLITAGPTREFFDDIRYISNQSSGRMGYSLAEAARDRGHQVTLISGPVSLSAPEGVELIPVISAEQMREAVLKILPQTDIIVMCAAVADYRPARRMTGKMKKGPDTLQLELVKNPDILAEIGQRRTSSYLVGFALEAENPLENARKKLVSKNTDMIVLNLPSAMNAEETEVQVLTKGGDVQKMGPGKKRKIADDLISLIDQKSTTKRADG